MIGVVCKIKIKVEKKIRWYMSITLPKPRHLYER
jgi:hypothetical protein